MDRRLEAGSAPGRWDLPGAAAGCQPWRRDYEDAVAGHAARCDRGAAPILHDLGEKLNQLVKGMTRADKIEDAIKVDNLYDELKKNGITILTGSTTVTAMRINSKKYKRLTGTPRTLAWVSSKQIASS